MNFPRDLLATRCCRGRPRTSMPHDAGSCSSCSLLTRYPAGVYPYSYKPLARNLTRVDSLLGSVPVSCAVGWRSCPVSEPANGVRTVSRSANPIFLITARPPDANCQVYAAINVCDGNPDFDVSKFRIEIAFLCLIDRLTDEKWSQKRQAGDIWP